LREQAEELLKNEPALVTSLSAEKDMLKLIHELEVHQVELELQNEELMLARTAALSAAEKYKELYDFAPSGYFTLSGEGEIMELNLSGANMLGKERLQLIYSRFIFFVTDDTKTAFNSFLHKIFKSKAKETCELALAINGNLRMYIHLTGIISGDGKQCLVNATDVTSFKLMEKNLLSSKALLNETQKSGKIGGWVLDINTYTQTWTEETFHIFEIDLTKGEPESPEGMDFIAPDFRQMAENAIQRAIEYGEPYDQEWEIITAKGNKRWVHAITKTNQENGKTISISGSFQDITERKLVEIALKKRTAELEKLNDYFIGRELKMIDLKKEINELLKKLGSEPKYVINKGK